MFDLPNLMHVLALQRGIYHSEADFQHAFAWAVHQRLPRASVRIERPIKVNGKTLHLDFLVQAAKMSIAVELKYKTRKLGVDLNGEEFRLASHSAADLGRYDFIKDVCRLEEIASSLNDCDGWAIMLTNDSAYWKPSNDKKTVDAAFRIHHGRILGGRLGWTADASDGTKRGRESDLQLIGRYLLQWSDYSAPSTDSYGQFRYLAVHVPRSSS